MTKVDTNRTDVLNVRSAVNGAGAFAWLEDKIDATFAMIGLL